MRYRTYYSWITVAAGTTMLTGCTAVASAADTQNWHCSAAAGAFQTEALSVPGNVRQVTGKLVFKELHHEADWNPNARLVFHNAGIAASGCRCVGISVSHDQRDPDWFQISTDRAGVQTPFARTPVANPVTFRLSFAPDGNATLEVGSASVTIEAPPSQWQPGEMTCSSAKVAFEDIAIKDFPLPTRSAPGAPAPGAT